MNIFNLITRHFEPEVKPIIRKFGWKRDLHDKNDIKFTAEAPVPTPPLIDLRPYCPPVYDQGELGSCHDDKTEVLTINGWKLFKDITKEDKLASIDPITKNLIFENPITITSYDYNGILYKSNHKHLDFAVTPNHKMLIRKWNENEKTLSDKYELIEIQNIGWYSGLLNNIKNSGEKNISKYIIKGIEHKHISQRSDRIFSINHWLEFLGIFVAEGTLLKEKYKIQLAASKEREKNYIRNILNELNIHALELKDRFTFENKQIYLELTTLGFSNIKAPQKFVPQFIFKLSDENIKHFLFGHKMGDGCEEDGLWSHYTSSKQLADDLQRLIFLSGQWSSLYERPSRNSTMKDGRIINGNYPEYRISCWNTNNLSIERKTQIIQENYCGIVYCAEVPTYHTLITRRNGKTLISGNCTANALAGAYEFEQMKQKEKNYAMQSRLFIYYNERAMEGTIKSDAGAALRDGIKSLNTQGTCPESMWAYNINKFATKPPCNCYTIALKNEIKQYLSVNNTLTDIKQCLAQGYPIAFGISVYSSFMSDEVAQTGIVPMPQPNDSLEGGHAILGVGYNDSKNALIIRNSWGTGWGLKGYFLLPYAYITTPNLASDFWTIRLVA